MGTVTDLVVSVAPKVMVGEATSVLLAFFTWKVKVAPLKPGAVLIVLLIVRLTSALALMLTVPFALVVKPLEPVSVAVSVNLPLV